jgi:hypothetical protein
MNIALFHLPMQQSSESRSETDGGQAERNMEIDRGLRKRPRELEESDEDDVSNLS